MTKSNKVVRKRTVKEFLDTKKMLDEILELVSSDFCHDTEWKLLPNSKPYTQDEAKKMAGLLGSVYMIAHCIHCTACQKKYIIPKVNPKKTK